MNEDEVRRALQRLPYRRVPDPDRLLASYEALPRRGERGPSVFVGALLAGSALALCLRPAAPVRALDEGLLRRTQQVARACIERLEERL